MLTDRVRQWSQGILDPIAELLAKTGVSPNVVTFIGFLLMVLVGVVISQGYLLAAGVLLILAAVSSPRPSIISSTRAALFFG